MVWGHTVDTENPGLEIAMLFTFTHMRGTERTEQYLAQEFADVIVVHYPDAYPADFVLADHSHEGLRPGAATVAWEGSGFDWTIHWLDTPAARRLADQLAVTLEALNGHTLP